MKVPLIVRDPRAEADATRGTVSDALVEAIDLAPTFLEMAGGAPRPHVLEGRSLGPLLRGETPEAWREVVICEEDYGFGPAGELSEDPRLFMVFDGRFKLIHAEGLRPLLFDLETDPEEFRDLGADPGHEGTRAALYDKLHAWARRLSQRTTLSPEEKAAFGARSARTGIVLGAWDDADVAGDLAVKYRRRMEGEA